MSASSQYPVTLNGQGYLLVEGSYRERAQQAFSPRFATGDPSTGDLSFWQFLKQEAWSGGAGQLVFSVVNKIQRSSGWSFLRGKPALCGGDSVASTSTPVQMLDEESSSIGWPFINQILAYGKEAANAPCFILGGKKSDGTFDGTIGSLRSATTSLAAIKQIQAAGLATWHRSQFTSAGGTILGFGFNDGSNRYRFVDNDGTNLYTATLAPTAAGTLSPRCGIALDDTHFLVVGPGSHNGANGLVYARMEFGAGGWTVNTSFGSSSVAPEIPSPYACLDSSATLYVVCSSDGITPSTELSGSSLCLFVTADLLAANGPILSAIVPYPDYHFGGAFAVGGTAYMIGVRKRKQGASTYYRAAVVKYPNTVIWESEYESTTLLNVMPRAFHQVSRNEVIFVNSKLDSGEAQSIMRLTLSDVVEEVAAFSKDATGARIRAGALFKQGASFYVYDIANNNFRLVTSDPSDSLAVSATRSLKLSRFGGNTSLIQKTAYAVTIELSEAISSSQTLTIKLNGTTVGTMVTADGTRKEIILTTEVTGSYFEPTLEMPSSATWPGTIENFYIRYVPTQFKKKQWGMMFRATGKLLRVDGTRELSPAITLFDAIKTAWASNVPVTFVDIEGDSYSVLVTDYDRRIPLLDPDTNRLEQLCSVELLEA